MKKHIVLLALLFAFVFVGCTTKIEKKLDELATKVDSLEKQMGEIKKEVARPQAPQRPQIDFDKEYTIPIEGSPFKGAKDAKMTIIEFSDFQCPFCAQAAPAVLEFVTKYPKDVKVVFKQFPLQFHQNARPAAIASLAAHRQGKFWQMHDELFKNSRDLSPATINASAKKIGLNMKQFEKDMLDKAIADQVDKDFTDGRNAEVTGTPMLYINGKKARSRGMEFFEAELQRIKSGS